MSMTGAPAKRSEANSGGASARAQRVERALFRGANLTIENPDYRRTVRAFTEELLGADLNPADLTAEALGLGGKAATAVILAREAGVAAGLEECALMARGFGIEVAFAKRDGDEIANGDALLRLAGDRGKLLAIERVALNVVQRMSGIATATRRMQERVRAVPSAARVVGTRKTPWGLLDKRALHLGDGGTHRIGLGDAILVKNNHLALLGGREDEAVATAIGRAWKQRTGAAFIEVEVRTAAGALAAAREYRRRQSEDRAEEYPCLVMLDNMSPSEIGAVLEDLRRAELRECALIEASGGISEENVEAYAACGVDAISVGALTHSPRALDVSQTIS